MIHKITSRSNDLFLIFLNWVKIQKSVGILRVSQITPNQQFFFLQLIT